MYDDVMKSLEKQVPKSFYQVFAANSDSYFDYEPTLPLFQSQHLHACHNFAYREWLKDEAKRYTIIQVYDGSCRGGYGFPDAE